MTREEWLIAGVEKFRPHYNGCKLEIPDVHVSFGVPKGGLSKKRVRGECWNSVCTNNGSRHIFISPIEGADTLEILGILSHELLHSALPDDAKHGKKFKDGMAQLGLEGKTKNRRCPVPSFGALSRRWLWNWVTAHTHSVDSEGKERQKKQQENVLSCSLPGKLRGCEKGCLLLDKVKGTDYIVSAGVKSLKLGMPACPCGTELNS